MHITDNHLITSGALLYVKQRKLTVDGLINEHNNIIGFLLVFHAIAGSSHVGP